MDVGLIAGYLKTSVFLCGTAGQPQSCEPAGKPSSGGTKAWQVVYTDLMSPRCINCHPKVSALPSFYGFPQDYPRQGDDRHPHYFGVLRGDDLSPNADGSPNQDSPGIGTPFERCTSCHGTKNDPVTGIPGSVNPNNPGVPFWELSPRVVAWESAPGVPFTGPELCAQLKDPNRNGHRSLADLLKHLTDDNLVNWAFDPGIRPNGEPRTTPPISHEKLIQAFTDWMNDGAPCPNN